eukprot:CAMPEP_0170113234 /NCGR_PEP_ID=MMETSP0020_2-20130122/9737_1 /TAXON_ID=98059 /ORGANISM="Dinobryon sp., Strain UTEXLB2267" /LENGTH=1097 /DNA_ID=CAMNT_0010339491 /DNA_START=44 /DNA_END=3337 /DNA_ORIENTATION=+
MDSKIRSMLRTTEELVAQSRLNQIAREHKSIGSILDDREIFALEDPNWRFPRKNGKIEVEKRVNARRGGRAEVDIKEQVDYVIDNLHEKGINVATMANDFDVERNIWKSLSREKEYFAKMNHQHPELQELREKLEGAEKAAFNEKVKKAIINLSEKFREECRALKRELDTNGVFHPEANAHRVHCLYRLKLYKNLHCYSIEFPILKIMHDEKLRIAREEKRKADLLARFEKSGQWSRTTDKTESNVSTNNSSSPSNISGTDSKPVDSFSTNNKDTSTANHQQSHHQKLEESSDQQLISKPGKSSLGVRFTEDSKSLTKNSSTSSSATPNKLGGDNHSKSLGALPKKIGNSSASVTSSSSVQSGTSGLHGHKLKPISSDLATTLEEDQENGSNGSSRNLTAAKSGTGLSSAAASAIMPSVNGAPTDRVFQRIKRGKLGGADPRSLLLDEAVRLDKGEVSAVRKNRDKNDILDDQVTNWMLGSLQQNQIAKTALGGAGVAPPLPASLASKTSSQSLQISPLVQNFSKSLTTSTANDTPYVPDNALSPQKMMPFDQFYKMFDEYRSMATLAGSQAAASNSHVASNVYHGININASSHSTGHGNVHGFSGPSKLGKHSHHPMHASATNVHDVKKKPLSLSLTGMEVFGEESESDLNATAGNATTSHPNNASNIESPDQLRPAALNIVKHLSDIDPQFAAFLKLTGGQKSNERTMAKLNGKMTKPKKARKLNLLGKDAVNLQSQSAKGTHSSRRRGGVTTQGFTNYFSLPSKADSDNDDKSSEDEAVEAQTHSRPRSDDLLTRLRTMDEDEISHVTEEESAHKKEDGFGRRNGVLETDGAESVDNSLFSASLGSSQSRTGSRARNRQRSNHAGSETQLDIQSKLTVVWDCLLLSATSRIAFMRKYSLMNYCRNMCKAVDMWAETTVFLLALVNLLAIEKKIKEGTCSSLPLDSRSIWTTFKKRVPQLLSSNASSLVPISIQRSSTHGDGGGLSPDSPGRFVGGGSIKQESPLSAIAVVKVKAIIEQVYSSPKGMDLVKVATESADPNTPTVRLLHLMIDELLPELSNSLLRAQQELDDSIPYKNKTCKEWMLELALRERHIT